MFRLAKDYWYGDSVFQFLQDLRPDRTRVGKSNWWLFQMGGNCELVQFRVLRETFDFELPLI